MATIEIETQPVQDPIAEERLAEPEDEMSSDDSTPEHKSGVIVDPNALMASGKFEKGDTVHMSMTVNGMHTRGVFTIYKAHYSKSKRCWTYQLKDSRSYLHNDGEWIRENVLKKESRRK